MGQRHSQKLIEPLEHLRSACGQVAGRASHVRIRDDGVANYAGSLPLADAPTGGAAQTGWPHADRDELAAFWLTLDAINFGSGWFPTLRKPGGHSGYNTIAAGLREHFEQRAAWTPEQLAQIEAPDIAVVLGQDPGHKLMGLFATSLRDLGIRVGAAGGFAAVVDAAGGSAAALVELLAAWECFGDTSWYNGLELPFLKRAQIAAADLHRAGVACFSDLHRLTMFADNLVPHVLRLDGVLEFEPELVARIEREELLEHGSPAEVEIRACAVQAVELIVAARPGSLPVQIDELLWLRGQTPAYKARPRHRSRCTAY